MLPAAVFIIIFMPPILSQTGKFKQGFGHWFLDYGVILSQTGKYKQGLDHWFMENDLIIFRASLPLKYYPNHIYATLVVLYRHHYCYIFIVILCERY